VGFGIGRLPGHVSVLGGLADAAVVGSALVAEIEKAPSTRSSLLGTPRAGPLLKEAGRKGLSRPRGPRTHERNHAFCPRCEPAARLSITEASDERMPKRSRGALVSWSREFTHQPRRLAIADGYFMNISDWPASA